SKSPRLLSPRNQAKNSLPNESAFPGGAQSRLLIRLRNSYRMHFQDRADAGRHLARELARWQGVRDLIVLALPRGGVPVGYEIARRLHAPLDVFVVRKLGVPGQEELAMGAVASGGALVFNDEIVFGLGIPDDIVGRVVSTQRME